MHQSSTSASTNIKNLAIALEALSRINGQSNIMYSIEILLNAEIELAKEQANPEPPQAKTEDDEIPF